MRITFNWIWREISSLVTSNRAGTDQATSDEETLSSGWKVNLNARSYCDFSCNSWNWQLIDSILCEKVFVTLKSLDSNAWKLWMVLIWNICMGKVTLAPMTIKKKMAYWLLLQSYRPISLKLHTAEWGTGSCGFNPNDLSQNDESKGFVSFPTKRETK